MIQVCEPDLVGDTVQKGHEPLFFVPHRLEETINPDLFLFPFRDVDDVSKQPDRISVNAFCLCDCFYPFFYPFPTHKFQFEIIWYSFLNCPAERVLKNRAIFRGIKCQVILDIIGVKLIRYFVYAIDLICPRDRLGGDIVFPSADVRHLLGLLQQLLAPEESPLALFAVTDVPYDLDCACQIPVHIVERGRGAPEVGASTPENIRDKSL
ncbi:MAG: hypothetical protein A4E37_01818 [Methanoregulaceae archaeon PtaB.Bin056]|nr:MAG: hypothetical protein A4E37_01818 [Methanoregulaceae archaeon PtaB.Bin056]